MFEKWKTNGGIVGSGAGSCCGGVWHHFLRVGWLWMGGGMIGEAICVGFMIEGRIRWPRSVEVC